MVDFVKVGMKISELRRSAGLNQEELADKLFVTRQALSKWENGLSVPSIDTLCEISRMFAVSIEEILGLFDNEELKVSEDNIFRGHDRGFVLNKIAEGKINVNIPNVFYQLSPAERMYILKKIKEGRIVVDRDELWVRLTPSEQRFLGGTYYEICESDDRRKRVLPQGRG